MAKVVFVPDSATHECDDGTQLIDLCEELDVSLKFGCTEGTCGVCELTVVKGQNNLSPATEEERDYLYEEDLEAGMRLGCQLRVKRGTVEITWKGNRAK
ncbi:MAG: 2Fe-2S iron-sulfur cluster-binding protein [Nitrospinaceae bacterium]